MKTFINQVVSNVVHIIQLFEKLQRIFQTKIFHTRFFGLNLVTN